MDALSKALENIRNSLECQEALRNTLQPGSTSQDGKSITMPPLLSEHKSGQLGQSSTIATPPSEPTTSPEKSLPAEPLGELPQWDQIPLKASPQAQDQLTWLLSQTFASQKTYGDKAQMMEYRDGMFQAVLADFSFERIKAALIEHVKRKPDLPTPSDIYNQIDPPKPALSAAVYVGLKQRIQEGYYPLSDEKAFMRAFEAQEMAKAGLPFDQEKAKKWDELTPTGQLEYKSNMKVF